MFRLSVFSLISHSQRTTSCEDILGTDERWRKFLRAGLGFQNINFPVRSEVTEYRIIYCSVIILPSKFNLCSMFFVSIYLYVPRQYLTFKTKYNDNTTFECINAYLSFPINLAFSFPLFFEWCHLRGWLHDHFSSRVLGYLSCRDGLPFLINLFCRNNYMNIFRAGYRDVHILGLKARNIFQPRTWDVKMII